MKHLAVIARVAAAAAVYAIDKPYDYLVPAALEERAKSGVRVTVPFGRGNRVSEGVILTLTEESRMPELKSVLSVLDDESVLGPAQIKLALWLRERTFCTLYEAVKALLPAGLWYRVREVCALTVSREEALEAGENDKESRLLEALTAHGGSAELETLRLACGAEILPGYWLCSGLEAAGGGRCRKEKDGGAATAASGRRTGTTV